ncbi:hypothetical protein SAMN04515648_4573 [Phyllobacterium sp. CL33Tsu]|uniref:hypothetical protein n=1 Tax=Phyllobacterium sp. CL33Tsu TaxID=1798191 RepID=UPI0008E69223|nr:hypothetical protein [Phyllobacterium sp. CL33Tsu]SFJ55335.1 hypothetical protein SAMN04515648_4573 [Phyllobacterium sp. CL33Tsu]
MTILEGFKAAVSALAGAAVTAAFYALVIIPIERNDARRGYVAEARATAAEAKADKIQRERNANQIVIDAYQVQLKNARAAEAEKVEKHETEIAEHEAKLRAAGRSCLVDDADRDWLLKP